MPAYDLDATIEDGSAEYDCYGCIDPNACNYDPFYDDDGSCDLTCAGCTDDFACNYDLDATIEDGSCNYDCYGCIDPNACNYDPTSTDDDGSCEYLTCAGVPTTLPATTT